MAKYEIISGAGRNYDKHVTAADVATTWGLTLSEFIKNKIESANLVYSELTPKERDRALIFNLKVLLEFGLDQSGAHQLSKWEEGWSENLKVFEKSGNRADLAPHYFGKYDLVRWNRNFIKPRSDDFEYKFLEIIFERLVEKYAKNVPAFYEFGCGTGHHLLQAREVNKEAYMCGLDWTEVSQAIIAEMVQRGIIQNAEGRRFDFFSPDLTMKLHPGSAVCTVAALEQIHDGYEKFVEYLIAEKPEVCFHVEPIGETLDEENLLDFLSVEYFKYRNYLNGFLNYLKNLEKNGRIEILESGRTGFGDFMKDGYSIVVWRPK